MPYLYSAALGNAGTLGAGVSSSAFFVSGVAGTSSFRLKSRASRLRRLAPEALASPRVNTIKAAGVTISVSTVANARPYTIADDSEIHHCVEGALMVVS